MKKINFDIKNKPFVVAEISANHCGSISLAKRLITTAKQNGADAVKLQTYSPNSMTVNTRKKDFIIKSGLWKGNNLWDLYKKAQTPHQWHKELFLHAKKLHIVCFSTPFDIKDVDLLEKLNCPMYKIASFEMSDLSLINRIIKTRKPIILSTGLSNLAEIDFVYKYIKKRGVKNLALLYCVSNYPAKKEDFNLNNITILKKKYKCKIGFSDHSNDSKIACAAVAVGAEIVEKHIATEGQNRGLDIDFSLKGKKIKKFINDLKFTYEILGKKNFFRSKNEMKNKIFKRSIYSIKNIKKGEKFSKINIRSIRPGFGISPLYYFKLIGKKSPMNIQKFSPIKIKILKKLKVKNFLNL